MEVIHSRCAGLDVHKETVVACVRLALDGKVTREIRTFETTTSGLLLLLAWLTEMGCTHVAMEATGVYWKPIWNILSDGDFELVLANAAHIKNVPGRKTDVSDAAWIADLLAHGLIRSSFIPDQEIQELRELLRTRKQLGRQQRRHIQRLQKTLEGANIKLDSVITDIVGKSGRAMIRALIAGEADPVKLAALADGRIKASPQELREALRGRVRDHHRFLLHLHLQHVEFADAAILDIDRNVAALIARMDQQVEAGRTFQTLIALLITIPGIDVLAARIILSEIGPDMNRFPTAGHLLSWAGLCPRNDESAGKRRSTRLRKGDRWLGCQAQERQLLQRPIPPSHRATWAQKRRLRRRCLPPHDDLPHAQGRHTIPGSRCRSFRPPLEGSQGQTPHQPTRKAWLRRQAHAPRRSCLRSPPMSPAKESLMIKLAHHLSRPRGTTGSLRRVPCLPVSS